MYADHFKLREPPFSIAPNPHYLYMSSQHKEALAHLQFGVQQNGGFVLLTGEVGTGKTTLCKKLIEKLPKDIEVAFVLNPRITEIELLETICEEFGMKVTKNAKLKSLIDSLNEYLLKCHSLEKKTVLIIDEAQNLSRDLLEQLRLLTNLETNERKLLQIILLGQPELAEKIKEEDLRQFNQRITARYHLTELNESEAKEYIKHRLTVAGGQDKLFSKSAIKQIFRESKGIPRVINLLCDRSLLGGYGENKKIITKKMVKKSSQEVLGEKKLLRKPISTILSAALLVQACIIISLYSWKEIFFADKTSSDQYAEHLRDQSAKISESLRGHAESSIALHDLISLWGISFEDRQTNFCSLSEKIGLRCKELDLDLEQIFFINRPFVTLLDQQFFTVSRFENNYFQVFAGDKEYQLEISDFRELFQGKIKILWRMPPGYSEPLKLNDKGAAVDWLIFQLALLDNEEPPVEGNLLFSEVSVQKVKDFQKTLGINATGVVDPLTWIQLNSAGTTPIPKLSD
ncbi:MAG: AAA family ATPase [Gammaproteobacteria bacterium]|nr:AAA family ATPase [Gammaproteobacteria bacterium]